MIPTLKKEDSIHYITETMFVEFINKNSTMNWDECESYVRNIGLINKHVNLTYWTKDSITKLNGNLTELYGWVMAFFNAHPWMDKIMIVTYKN